MYMTALVCFNKRLLSQPAAIATYAAAIWALWSPLSMLAVAQDESIRVDRSTLLFASFDEGARPDHAPNVYRVEGSAQPIHNGRKGGGLRASERSYLMMSGGATGLTADQGTIECWIRTRWPERENRERLVFDLDFGEHSLVRLKRDARGRFGFAIARPDGAGSRFLIYLRSEPGALRSGKWHHVMLSWTGRRSEFRIDGQLIVIERQTVFPFLKRGNLRISGSDFDVDDLRISVIDRSQSMPADEARDRITTPISPTRNRQWEFVEPISANRLQRSRNFSKSALSWRYKPLFSDFDPASDWRDESASTIRLDMVPGFGARGAFVIAAQTHLLGVDIELRDVVGPDGQAIALETEFARIVRTFERRYWRAPQDDHVPVARFLTPWRARDFSAAEFSEVWLAVEAPVGLSPGSYKGTIHVSSSSEQDLAIPLELTLRDYSLDTGGRKALGIYYHFEDKLFDEGQILLELEDLREHGIRHLITDLQLQHSPADANYRANLETTRRGLELIHRGGFRDLVVIQNGLVRVAKWRARETSESIENDKVFAKVVDRTMSDLAGLVAEFPDLDIYQTHSDEVFANQATLEAYIEIANHIRRTSKVPLFITLNTWEKNEALRKRLDPFVDFRGMHGYSFEWWMERGHHISEMEQELATAGDRALFYHNARGPYFTPQRSRIVNGLLLWAWPFESHAPWIYQDYAGNPFDDRDALPHDFGMAFPGSTGELVSTRIWEATREGWIDLQHLQTLERLIAENERTKPGVVIRARSYLESVRNLIREATPVALFDFSGTTKNASGGLFLPQPGQKLTPEETPLLNALEKELGASGLTNIRAKLAAFIEELSRPL